MGIKFKVGQPVRQVVKVIAGVVTEAQIVDGDQVHFRVDWKDADGNEQSKYFTEDQIEATDDGAAAVAA